MSIELPPNGFGLTIFFVVLMVFECLFGVIGYYVACFFKLPGFAWWIVFLSIIIFLNMVFVNVKLN